MTNCKINEKTIIKVIALRVSPNPSKEMKENLTAVKSWTETHKVEFLEFDNNNYAN